MQADLAPIQQLMMLATGDEKHDESAHSTLDVLWVLYDRILRYDPHNPRWEDRDRFVLSKGHGPIALYAILANKGFFSPTHLKTFRTWDSILGGHPDRNLVPGVEANKVPILPPGSLAGTIIRTLPTPTVAPVGRGAHRD